MTNINFPDSIFIDEEYILYEKNDLEFMQQCLKKGNNYPIRILFAEDQQENSSTIFTHLLLLFIGFRGFLTMDISSLGDDRETTILFSNEEIMDRNQKGIKLAIYIKKSLF